MKRAILTGCSPDARRAGAAPNRPGGRGWTLRAGLGRLRGSFPRKIAVPMRLPRLLIVFLLLGVAALSPLRAQTAGSPYSVIVPVTGGQDLRSNPGYAEALGSASSLVQKFQYQRAATGLVLEVDFAPSSVRRLVAKLGVA